MESSKTAQQQLASEENVFKTPDPVDKSSFLESKLERKTSPTHPGNGDLEKSESTENPVDFAKKKNEFLTPSSLPPPRRKEERSPVLMTFKSKFAIPADIYKIPKVAAFISSSQPKTSTTDATQNSLEIEEKNEPELKTTDTKSTKPLQAKFTYQEPDWSLEPMEGRYSLEILKMGAIVGKIELSKKEFFIVGRLADCEIIMEHPSISRYHAVLQYGAPEEECENVQLQKDGTPGFYVYDLGSTHGTIINKSSISAKTYYRIKVGHVLKFGGSTRMYILQGPENDQEDEAQESATKLREMNKMKIKKKQELERRMLGEDSSSSDEEEGSKKPEKNKEDSGITWGMLEDAVASSSDEEEEEEEGDTLDMHPDAVTVQVKKDPFYVKDPQKALKNLYEREKMELEFECTERRSGQWNVRLCLPVTERSGKPIYAEAIATGKKKAAIAQCSLEACRILEKHGMFHYKDHHKQKLKQWEKDDYYDSDEDEFHDRTGDLEKKRKQRMKRTGKASKAPQKVETYETLSKQLKELEDEVKDIEAKLSKDKEATSVSAHVADPLDAFMQKIKLGKALDTTTRAKLKHRLFEAKKELVQVFKLAQIARPSSLPPLKSSVKKYSFIGQMKGKKRFLAPMIRPIQQPQVLEDSSKYENVVEEEEEEMAERTNQEAVVEDDIKNEPKKIKTDMDSNITDERTSTDGTNSASVSPKTASKVPENTTTSGGKTDTSKNTAIMSAVKQVDKKIQVHETSSRKRVLGPTLPPELRDKLIKEQNNEQESTEDGNREPKKRKRRVRKPKPQATKDPSQDTSQYSEDPKYAMWLPPEDGEVVSTEYLEETLSCDDLFLQYFNSFLELPAFPLKLRYDRLTGTFHNLNKENESAHASTRTRSTDSKLIDAFSSGSVHGLHGNAPYAAKEDEKERLLQWAKENRLSLFVKSRLHHEFKLCKLLVRPLDYRRGSSRIRGYSRLSVGTTATSYTPTGDLGSPIPDNQSHLDWNDGQSIKCVSYGLGSASERSRRNSMTQSLPTDFAARNWSSVAMYDTSATETSSTTEVGYGTWHNDKKHRDLRTKSNKTDVVRRSENYHGSVDVEHGNSIDDVMRSRSRKRYSERSHGVSDSGLGATAIDSVTVGTSGKTRNIATRADTLGVGSRWESEGYSTRTPDTRSHTAMTSSSLPADGFRTPPSQHYEGKSALRTANSPSKPHRAKIILPQNKNSQPPLAETSSGSKENATSSTSKVDSDSEKFSIAESEDDVIDDDDVSAFLEFDDRESSCDETETEIASIQRVHSMKLQHIKEKLLGTKEGMDSLLDFLSDTAGGNLVSFWIDAESFREALDQQHPQDQIQDDQSNKRETAEAFKALLRDDGVAMAWRHRLFRDILDRHKVTLTEEAKDHIREAQNNLGLTYQVFSHAQYDALRRLRSYWLPRYIVHCSTKVGFDKRLSIGSWDVDSSSKGRSSSSAFLPLLTIGQIVPTAELSGVGGFLVGKDVTVRPLASVNAEVAATLDRPSTAQIRVMSARSASNHLLLRTLAAESDGGFPFRQYLIMKENTTAWNAYDFWITLEHLTDRTNTNHESKPTQAMSLLKSGSSADDCCLAVTDAWKLLSNFLKTEDAPRSLDLNPKMNSYVRSLDNLLRDVLKKDHTDSSNTVPSSIFRPAKIYTLSVLAACWKTYCDHEQASFFEAKEGRPFSPPALEKPSTPQTTAIEKKVRQADEMSTSLSEATTNFSRPWLTDEDTTETDSASTMYSYDVERIRQIAAIIRQKGAKKPQRVPPRRPPPFVKRRIATANKNLLGTDGPKGKTRQGSEAGDSVSSKTSKKKQTKVQFSLPDKTESLQIEATEEKKQDHDEEDAGDEESDEEEKERKKKKRKKSLIHRHPNRMMYLELKENKLLHGYFRKYVAQCESMEVQNVFQMYSLCEVLRFVPMGEVQRRSALANELSRTYLSSTGPKQIAMSSEFSSPFINELPNPSVEVVEALQGYVLATLNQASANFSLGFGTALKEYKLDIRSDLAQNITKAELALRTLTLKPSSKRRRALGKHSARQPPTSDHKQSFMDALARATEGDLPLDLLHFYKYLQGFGSQEGFPLIHNDLLFYVEVSKFVACFHEAHDLVTLKRKVQSIVNCFITSEMEPNLQIDIKTGTAERLRRASENFINDKGRDPHTANLFEDSQHTVFNELLPFWSGFATARPLAEREGKRPVLKSERLQKRRLEAFKKTPDPKKEFDIPSSVPKFDMHGLEFTFSVNGGIQWKEWSEVSSSRSSTPPLAGVIEIVKMPPRGQARRMVRRGNFMVRKLDIVKETPREKSKGSHKGLKDQKHGTKLNPRSKTTSESSTRGISYTTSVS